MIDTKYYKYLSEKAILLEIALRNVGLSVDIPTVDILTEVVNKLEEKGDKTNLKDLTSIKIQFDEKWRVIYEQEEKENQEL